MPNEHLVITLDGPAGAGGVGGAEGSLWLGISGEHSQENDALALLQSVAGEPAFVL